MPHSQLDEVHHAKVALAQLRTSGTHPGAAEALHGLIQKHEALQEKQRAAEGKAPPAHKQADTYSQQLSASQPREEKPNAGSAVAKADSETKPATEDKPAASDKTPAHHKRH